MPRKRHATLSVPRLMRGLLAGEGGRLALAMDAAGLADVVRLPVPGRPRFVITHPDDIRHVLVTRRARYRKSRDYRVLEEFMGRGLVTSEDPRWGEDRALLQPSFSQAATARFRDAVTAEVERLAGRWAARPAGEPLDVFAEMMRLTIAVIGRRLFSVDLSPHAERIRLCIHTLATHVFRRSQSPLDLARFLPTPGQRAAARARAELGALLEPHLAQPSAEGEAVLAALHRGGRSREEILDHVITMLAAGYDTTGNALGWCLHALAADPALQDELARDPGDEAVAALVKETLRRFPTVPGVGREALEDDRLGDVPVPRGSTVLVFIQGLHHREELWPDPARFDPGRFRGEGKKIPAHGYLPFGAGPRVCIGAHLAVQEMTVVLGRLVPRFRLGLTAGPAPVPVPGISLAPWRRVLLAVTAR
jgi:cytochrome P450